MYDLLNGTLVVIFFNYPINKQQLIFILQTVLIYTLMFVYDRHLSTRISVGLNY